MVSFQCDACQDVVKKPKLDQHHSRGCHASFTCIDCSKTFATPANWKSHTSCVSEAEKYQKSLYRPKNNGGGRGYGQAAGKGKFQGWGNRWERPPFAQYQPTGANSTPLGTPVRMSPVVLPPPTDAVVPNNESAQEEGQKPNKKRKLNGETADNGEGNNSTVAIEPAGKEKMKKDKKEKKIKHGETAETSYSVTNPPNTVLPSSNADAEKIPKEGKKKGGKADAGADKQSVIPTGEEIDKVEKKKEKRKKAEKGADAPVFEPAKATPVDTSADGGDGKKKKEKQKKAEKSGNVPAVDASVNATDGKEKKEKRKKVEFQEPGKTAPSDTTANSTVGEEKKEKKKKRKSSEDVAVDREVPTTDAPSQTQTNEKMKPKKRKRETTEGEETVESEVNEVKKMKKKKSSAS